MKLKPLITADRQLVAEQQIADEIRKVLAGDATVNETAKQVVDLLLTFVRQSRTVRIHQAKSTRYGWPDEITNEDRANAIADMLERYTDRNDPETDLTDLLAHQLHYCYLNDIDFDLCLSRATDHAEAEIEEEREDIYLKEKQA